VDIRGAPGRGIGAAFSLKRSPSASSSRPYNDGFRFVTDPLGLKPVIEIMPKQKTHKGVKKRFRVTASGKVKHRQAGTSHLAARKTHKQKRMLRGTTTLATQFTQQIKTALAGNSY
jgi:large subunit ribosomal protein L35